MSTFFDLWSSYLTSRLSVSSSLKWTLSQRLHWLLCRVNGIPSRLTSYSELVIRDTCHLLPVKYLGHPSGNFSPPPALWMFMCPPEDGIWRWDLWQVFRFWWGHECGAPMMGLLSVNEEKEASCKPGKEGVLPGTYLAGTLDLDPWPLKL